MCPPISTRQFPAPFQSYRTYSWTHDLSVSCRTGFLRREWICTRFLLAWQVMGSQDILRICILYGVCGLLFKTERPTSLKSSQWPTGKKKKKWSQAGKITKEKLQTGRHFCRQLFKCTTFLNHNFKCPILSNPHFNWQHRWHATHTTNKSHVGPPSIWFWPIWRQATEEAKAKPLA